MRRWDFCYVYDDSDRREVIEREHGDYVTHEDAVRALRDERYQTQRRMIAALYWRAGQYEIEARRPLQSIHMEARMRGAAFAMERTARAMEAAL